LLNDSIIIRNKYSDDVGSSTIASLVMTAWIVEIVSMVWRCSMSVRYSIIHSELTYCIHFTEKIIWLYFKCDDCTTQSILRQHYTDLRMWPHRSGWATYFTSRKCHVFRSSAATVILALRLSSSVRPPHRILAGTNPQSTSFDLPKKAEDGSLSSWVEG